MPGKRHQSSTGPKGLRLFEWFKKSKKPFARPLALVLLSYVVGLAIFAAEGHGEYFLTSLSAVIASVVIFAASGTAEWGYRVAEEVYTKAESLFTFDSDEGKDILNSARRRIHSDRNLAFVSVFTIIAFEAYVLLVKYKVIPATATFYNGVFTSLWTQVYLVIVAAYVGYIFADINYLSWIHISFSRALSRHKIHTRSLHRSRLENDTKRVKELSDVVMMSFKGSIFWFLGIALFEVATVLVGTVSATIELGISSVAIFTGLMLFFLPQYYFHRAISEAKKEALIDMRASFKAKWGGKEIEDLPIDALSERYMLSDQIERLEVWPIHYGVILTELSMSLIPLVVTLLLDYGGTTSIHP